MLSGEGISLNDIFCSSFVRFYHERSQYEAKYILLWARYLTLENYRKLPAVPIWIGGIASRKLGTFFVIQPSNNVADV